MYLRCDNSFHSIIWDFDVVRVKLTAGHDKKRTQEFMKKCGFKETEHYERFVLELTRICFKTAGKKSALFSDSDEEAKVLKDLKQIAKGRSQTKESVRQKQRR